MVGGLLLAVLAIRAASVQAFADQRAALAEKFWPSHPEVVASTTMAEIGRAAATGRPPDASTWRRMDQVLARAPLAAEPFLVEGTRAMAANDPSRATALLREAVRRDPRLPAARFLLANIYLQQGQASEGLKQIAALLRRLPRAAPALTAGIVQFAVQPGTADQVKPILDTNPELRAAVLADLSDNPDNARLVLALAGREPVAQSSPVWQSKLLSSLTNAGRYREGRQLWAWFAGLPEGSQPSLFNPDVRPSRAAPPFNWTLANAAGGIAESAAGGGLHLLFYGRDETVLAAQVMVLRPGKYRLDFVISGGTQPGSIAWTIACLPAVKRLAEEDISTGELSFIVPASGCEAQELKLQGSPRETPVTSDVTIRNLRLLRVGG